MIIKLKESMTESDVDNDECELLLTKTSLTNRNSNIKDIAIRKQNAKNRWKLLARAILSSSSSPLSDISKRDHQCCSSEIENNNVVKKLSMSPINIVSNMSQAFSGFELVKIEQMTKDDKTNYKITLDVDSNSYECNVHVEKLWSVKDLIGFNNTGNLSLWASEVALCYYAMENIEIFDNAWVLELGGGMFCLSALMIAKYSNAFAVHLSDGNEIAVQNVKKSIILNDFKNCFMKCTGRFAIRIFPALTHSLVFFLLFFYLSFFYFLFHSFFSILTYSSQMGKLNEAISIGETKIQLYRLC